MGNLFFDEPGVKSRSSFTWGGPDQLYWTILGVDEDLDHFDRYWTYVVIRFTSDPTGTLKGGAAATVVYDPTTIKRSPGKTVWVTWPDHVEPVPPDWKERLGCNG